MLARKRVFQAVTLACVLAMIDVGWWLLRGEKNLYRGLPKMADFGLELGAARARDAGFDIVIPSEQNHPLEPDVVEGLRATFASHGLRLLLEEELPSSRHLTNTQCPGCLAFGYGVVINTPLFARVYTHQFLYSGGSSILEHWRLWLFGTWLPLSDKMVGQE